MKAARVLVLVVALTAGGAAAFLVSSGDEKKPEPASAAVVKILFIAVLIAMGDIGKGMAVSRRNFQWRARPAATTGGNSLPSEMTEIHDRGDRKIDDGAAQFGVSANT
jgi:pilus assembly protein CpaB